MLRSKGRTRLSLTVTVLIMFAIGPGLALHALSDLYHAHQTNHEHDHDFADLGFGNDVHGDHACTLDHDHDQNHTASFAVASVTPPSAVMDVKFDVTQVTYVPLVQPAPPIPAISEIEKPPRLDTSI